MGSRVRGGVTPDSFRFAMQRLGINDVDTEDLDKLFRRLDHNKDDVLDFNEFSTGLLPTRRSVQQLILPSIPPSRLSTGAQCRQKMLQNAADAVEPGGGIDEPLPFINPMYLADPSFKSREWDPIYRHHGGGATFQDDPTTLRRCASVV